MANRVTVGLDGSPESTAAARWAAHEAELLGASLDLVHAEEWLENPPLPVTTTEDRRRWAEAVLRDPAEDVRRVHPSLKVDTRRVSGLPSLALTHTAEDSDMLVLGSRARQRRRVPRRIHRFRHRHRGGAPRRVGPVSGPRGQSAGRRPQPRARRGRRGHPPAL
ncbi:universal stress protein [Streptomyces virginiae]|uniref:universal stress protein n=1 Tax=Streptomyces virginiae TaxID=1961 RepID=UPI003719AE6B